MTSSSPPPRSRKLPFRAPATQACGAAREKEGRTVGEDVKHVGSMVHHTAERSSHTRVWVFRAISGILRLLRRVREMQVASEIPRAGRGILKERSKAKGV
eukprot:1897058-Rhodomonas_salina.1